MTAEMGTLRELFLHDLKSIYHVEMKLEDEIGQMAGEITDDGLRQNLESHLEETIRQRQRIEEIFDEIGEVAGEHETPAFKGLTDEIEHLNSDIVEEELINIAYLFEAKKVERLEITIYERLLMLARKLEMQDEVIDRLEENLDEEENALDDLEDVKEAKGMQGVIERLLS